MTNPMIMQLRIEQSRHQKEYKELQIKIVRLMNELASLVNPYFTEIEEIDAIAIEQIGDELLQCKSKVTEVLDKIRRISKDLGEGI